MKSSDWYVLIPVILYVIFVIIASIGFVFLARWRNCIINRIEDPVCYMDWQCNEADPVMKFKQEQVECGSVAIARMLDNLEGGEDDESRQACAVLKVLNKDECRKRWKKMPADSRPDVAALEALAGDDCDVEELNR